MTINEASQKAERILRDIDNNPGWEEAWVEICLCVRDIIWPKYSRILNEHDCNDFLQIVYIQVVRNYRLYPGDYPFSMWLFTLAKNLFIDCLRRNKYRHLFISFEELEGGDQIRSEENISDAVCNRDLRRKMDDALSTLTPEDKDMLIDSEIHCEKLADIAGKHGFTEMKVRMKVFNARRKLKNTLTRMGVTV